MHIRHLFLYSKALLRPFIVIQVSEKESMGSTYLMFPRILFVGNPNVPLFLVLWITRVLQ